MSSVRNIGQPGKETVAGRVALDAHNNLDHSRTTSTTEMPTNLCPRVPLPAPVCRLCDRGEAVGGGCHPVLNNPAPVYSRIPRSSWAWRPNPSCCRRNIRRTWPTLWGIGMSGYKSRSMRWGHLVLLKPGKKWHLSLVSGID